MTAKTSAGPNILRREAAHKIVFAAAGGIAALAITNHIAVNEVLLWKSQTEARLDHIESHVERLRISDATRRELERLLSRARREDRQHLQ
jgi:hypothetical protein